MESLDEDGIVERGADGLTFRSIGHGLVEHANSLVDSTDGIADGMGSGLHRAHDGRESLTAIGLGGHDETLMMSGADYSTSRVAADKVGWV